MRFLFVCIGNSCRSQIAEAIAKDLGYNAFEIGILSATRPGTRFIASIFWGYIADLTKSHALILKTVSLISCFAFSALLFGNIGLNIYWTATIIFIATWFKSVTGLLNAITLLVSQDSQQHSPSRTRTKCTIFARIYSSITLGTKFFKKLSRFWKNCTQFKP